MMEQKFDKKWGYELWFANNERYCGKLLHVNPGIWSSDGRFHYHKLKDETFFVISGTLLLDYQDDGMFYEIELSEGGSFRVPPGMKHRFSAKGETYCQFIEASTQHLEEDSYRCEWDKENEEWIES